MTKVNGCLRTKFNAWHVLVLAERTGLGPKVPPVLFDDIGVRRRNWLARRLFTPQNGAESC
jgi:hypothetical protein